MSSKTAKRIVPDYCRLPDADLVELYREHHIRGAFQTLIRRHEADLLTTVVKLAGDGGRALALFREVIIESALRISALRDPARFSEWLDELARHRACRRN